MPRINAITLVESLVLLVIAVVVLALFLPAIQRSRTAGQYSVSSTRVRGIHSGLVLHAQGNNSHYIGVLSDGRTIDPGVGLSVQGRMHALIRQKYFTREYARSSLEVQQGVTSYAMLQVNRLPNHQEISPSGRNEEWQDTTHPLAVVVSDRAIANGNGFAHIRSLYTQPEKGVSDWRGSVVRNDNSATFESTATAATQYGDTAHDADHLFVNQTGDAHAGSDAYMVFSSTDQL